MNEFLRSLFSNADSLKEAGNNILIAGLVGDIIVLFIPSKFRLFEKLLAIFFIFMIIGGIWMERVADNWNAEPRSLSVEQQADVAKKLSSFADQSVILGVIPPSFEHSSLATQIAQALSRAGIVPNFNQSVVESTIGPVRGVVARYVTGNTRGKTFAQAFATALRDQGVAASAEPGLAVIMPKPEEIEIKAASWVGIAVGDKP